MRCVLYIPPGPAFERWCEICTAYAIHHRYAIVAVATTWAAAVAMLIDGEASVAVTGRRDHIPPDHTPRVEVATEPQPVVSQSPMSRRTVRRRPATG